jgi:hypothetical protein
MTQVQINVEAADVSALDVSGADALVEMAFQRALATSSGLPRGFQATIASVPLLVTDAADEELLAWARDGSRRRKHWAALTYPIVLDCRGAVAYQTALGFWGVAHFRILRRIAERIVVPTVGATVTGAAPAVAS